MSLRIDQAEWSVIIVGQWNTRLFTPGWIGKNIFDVTEIPVELVYGAGVYSIRFATKHLKLVPQDERLVIQLLGTSDEALGATEQAVRKIATMLPQTPVQAFGINFAFVEEEPSDRLVSIFKAQDREALLAQGFQIKKESVIRSMPLNGCTVNFTLAHHVDDGRMDVRANFHHDVNSADMLKEKLDEGLFVKYREKTKFLLDKVYGLTLSETEEAPNETE